MGALAVAVAAAMWATDPYFRPALTKELTASQIVFVESLLIALCFLPVARRIRRELRDLPLRQWIAMGIIAVGAQAFATVLFTQALSYAFPAHAAPDFNVENDFSIEYIVVTIYSAVHSYRLLFDDLSAEMTVFYGIVQSWRIHWWEGTPGFEEKLRIASQLPLKGVSRKEVCDFGRDMLQKAKLRRHSI